MFTQCLAGAAKTIPVQDKQRRKPGGSEMPEENGIALQPDRAKPVLLFIYGPDIQYPYYDNLIHVRNQCERAGQPFIVIPEPDPTSSTPLASATEISEQLIANTLEKNFGKGGPYENRPFIALTYLHGTVIGDAHYHLTHQYVTETGELFKPLLAPLDANQKYLCQGIHDTSCHGGASLVDLAKIIDSGKIGREFHFFANNSFFESGQQLDMRAFVNALPALARKDTGFTVTHLKNAYLDAVGEDPIYYDKYNRVPGAAEKVFRAGEPVPRHAIAYEDLDKKLQYVMDNREEFKGLYNRQPDICRMLRQLDGCRTSDELRAKLQNEDKNDLFSEIMLTADRIYDETSQSVEAVRGFAKAFLPASLANRYHKRMPVENDVITPEYLGRYSKQLDLLKMMEFRAEEWPDEGETKKLLPSSTAPASAPHQHLLDMVSDLSRRAPDRLSMRYGAAGDDYLSRFTVQERNAVHAAILDAAIKNNPRSFLTGDPTIVQGMKADERLAVRQRAALEMAGVEPIALLYMMGDAANGPQKNILIEKIGKETYDKAMRGAASELSSGGVRLEDMLALGAYHKVWADCVAEPKQIWKQAISGHVTAENDKRRGLEMDLQCVLHECRHNDASGSAALEKVIAAALADLAITDVTLATPVTLPTDELQPLLPPRYYFPEEKTSHSDIAPPPPMPTVFQQKDNFSR